MRTDVRHFTAVEFYYLLLDAVLADPSKLGHGREGYYFVEGDESPMSAIVSALGRTLVDAGKIRPEDAAPTVLTAAECIEYFGSDFVAGIFFTNVRCRGDRGRRDLGWTPKYKTQDLFDGLREEVEALLKE